MTLPTDPDPDPRLPRRKPQAPAPAGGPTPLEIPTAQLASFFSLCGPAAQGNPTAPQGERR